MPINSLLGEFAASALRELQERDEANAKPIQAAWQEYAARSTHQPLRQGHARMRDIRRAFDAMNTPGNVASPQQSEIQEMCIRAAARVVYTRSVFEDNQLEIMRANNWSKKEMEQWILVSAPRRLGKTFALVRTDVALLLSIPNIFIVVFATTFEQANKLVEEVKKLLESHFPQQRIKYTVNEGKLRVYFPNNDVRTIVACSSSVDVRFALSFPARAFALVCTFTSRSDGMRGTNAQGRLQR